MAYERLKLPEDVDELSDIADPNMDICKFVEQYGTVGSSLVFAESIKKSSQPGEHLDITWKILANLQASLKKLREEKGCTCAFSR